MPFDAAQREQSTAAAVALLKSRRLVKDGDTLVIISDVLDETGAIDSIMLRRA
jgi:ribosomal protein L18E